MSGSAWQNDTFSLLIIDASGTFSGLFVYSPVPGPGNLVASIAAAAGTDPFGNAYPAGLSITGASSTLTGSDYVLNSSGLFLYDGPPGSNYGQGWMTF